MKFYDSDVRDVGTEEHRLASDEAWNTGEVDGRVDALQLGVDLPDASVSRVSTPSRRTRQSHKQRHR